MALLALPLVGSSAFAANHREAPITALDHKADITDVFAFRSYDGDNDSTNDPETLTVIMCVDPLLEPGNGPNYFPFDDEISYEIKIDNDNDAQADLTFQVRFTTELRNPSPDKVFTTLIGLGENGATAPDNAPTDFDGSSTVGAPVIPPQINDFEDAGLFLRQSYTVNLITDDSTSAISGTDPLYAVPANAGPRTMDYEALFTAATYTGLSQGISTFAGTVDDPFWIDLGGAFDTLSLDPDTGDVPGVLSDEVENAAANVAPDYVAGKAVNAIAIEIPLSLVQASTGSANVDNTLGIWCTTSRPRVTVRRAPFAPRSSGTFRQIQRMGNPLINELVIGTSNKNLFSMSQPVDDAQFAFIGDDPNGPFLNPLLPRAANAAYAALGVALPVPNPPRLDLLPLVTYSPPFTMDPSMEEAGPVADLLRINVAVPATPVASANRMGFLFGDSAGFPNGRRLFDDVTDIALRVVVGGMLVQDDPGTDADETEFFVDGIHNRLGDGVNVNDAPYRTSFPYLASCPSGNPDESAQN